MRIYFICAIALLLPGATLAQKAGIGQLSAPVTSCPNFLMPVIKPLVDENKSPIVKPDSKIDFKLIIVNPCVSKNESASTSLLPVVPLLNNKNNLQLPVAPLNLNENNFNFTMKQAVPLNPVFTIK